MEKEVLETVLALERKMYSALNEVLEVTEELSDAIQRQDQVSVQLFLKLRQEPIDRLQECRTRLINLCGRLPGADGAQLRRLLSGQGDGLIPGAETLEKQVHQTDNLLKRVLVVDQAVNRKIGGKKSFYTVRATAQ